MTSEQIQASDAEFERGRADALAGRHEARGNRAYQAGYDSGWSQRINLRHVPHAERRSTDGHAVHDVDMCPAEAGDWYCTRPAGHAGQHEAGTGPGGEVVATWDQA
jgi:hypothetical protein